MLPLRMLGLLMFMLTQCGADDGCFPDPDLLILEPPVIVGEYGASISLRCIGPVDDFKEMSLWIGNESIVNNDVRNNVSHTWTLTDWDVNAECIMKLNDTHECTKKAEIIVYQNPQVFLSTNPVNYFVEETLYEVQCDVTNVAPVQNLTVTWYKNGEVIRTDSFSEATKVPVNMSLSLMVNISRGENVAQLRCEARLNLSPQAPQHPVTSEISNVSARYRPFFKDCLDHHSVKEDEFSLDKWPCETDGNPPPTVNWYYRGELINPNKSLSRNDSGTYTAEVINSIGMSQTSFLITVQYAPEFRTNKRDDIIVSEGETVTLTCDVEGYPAPDFEWSFDGENMYENTKKLNVTLGNYSKNYTCMATNVLGNVTRTFPVQVAQVTTNQTYVATPPETDKKRDCGLKLTPSEIVVKFGDPAAINCSTSEKDVQILGWETPVNPIDVENRTSVLWKTDKVEKVENWDWTMYCFATFMDKQCNVTPTITIYKTPDVVSVSAVGADAMTEGGEYRLKCDIINVTPLKNLTVKWYRDDEVVFTEQPRNITGFQDDWSSTLTVTPKRSDHGSVYKCEADLDLKPVGPEINLSTFSSPYIAVVQYRPFFKDCLDHHSVKEDEFSLDKWPCETDGNPPPTVDWYYRDELINPNKSLSRNDSGTYTAEVINSIGTSRTSFLITVQYGPSFSCDKQYEVVVNGEGGVPCEPEGLPPPSITWFKNGNKIDTPQRWGQEDSGNYSLRAENPHGTAEHVLYIDAQYAPVFKDGNISMYVIPGENVTLECSAQGNPSPDVEWKSPLAGSVQGPAKGRQQIIITVTAATSTNASPYMCVATNKVGRVTRFVSLVEKGLNHESYNKLWLLLLLVPLVVLIVVCLRKNKKKQGRYSFITNTDIPLTAKSA
ncbi:intercellular adhesion molecule 5 [Cololabis saira]|uniref:intercellular adhesion molecule 5 n=1 Tax=Cololabis saira TaxID=129043 RepID=UPI002AD430BA|nr:intercellular adhesion molecule 5 [Cololabis saira]